MSEPTAVDKDLAGALAAEQLSRLHPGTGIWCYAGLEEVRVNLASTGYPVDRVHFVRGKVEDTIPGTVPEPIALLRLDTDWYESTKHELTHLFPRLVPGGVLIIDDYGHWQGARQATDEYFASARVPLLLHRVDYTGRIAVKMPSLTSDR
jgi:O-methyltransferase